MLATITITVDDADYDRVLNSYCAAQGYMAEVPNPDYPQAVTDRQAALDAAAADPDVEHPAAPELPPEYIDNPQSRAEFVQAHLASYMTRTVMDYESRMALEAAQQAAQDVPPVNIS